MRRDGCIMRDRRTRGNRVLTFPSAFGSTDAGCPAGPLKASSSGLSRPITRLPDRPAARTSALLPGVAGGSGCRGRGRASIQTMDGPASTRGSRRARLRPPPTKRQPCVRPSRRVELHLRDAPRPDPTGQPPRAGRVKAAEGSCAAGRLDASEHGGIPHGLTLCVPPGAERADCGPLRCSARPPGSGASSHAPLSGLDPPSARRPTGRRRDAGRPLVKFDLRLQRASNTGLETGACPALYAF